MVLGDDGLYRPKTFDVEIEEGRVISVPTYSLAQVNSIGIRSAKVRCDARLVDVVETEKKECFAHDGTVCTFRVNPAMDRAKSIEIEIEFSQRSHSEAEHRLIESLDGMVVEANQD